MDDPLRWQAPPSPSVVPAVRPPMDWGFPAPAPPVSAPPVDETTRAWPVSLPSRATRRAAKSTLDLTVVLPTVRRRLWFALGLVIVMDLLASAGAVAGVPYFFTRFFDGDSKLNFPTGYKVTFLLAATLLCAILSVLAKREGDAFAPGWRLLTLVCGFAFTDETVWLHQALSEQAHKQFSTHGLLSYSWTVIYLPIVVVVGVLLLRYLRFMDRRARLPLLAGGAVYTVGALGFEPVKSQISSSFGDGSAAFKFTALVSDSMELIGMTLLVLVLLGCLARRVTEVRFVVREQR